MDTDPEIWTSLMWCNFLRPVESRVYEEAKDKTKALLPCCLGFAYGLVMVGYLKKNGFCYVLWYSILCEEKRSWEKPLLGVWESFHQSGVVMSEVQKVLEDANDDYNLSHTAQMNLVFFQEPQWKQPKTWEILLLFW